MAINPSTVFSGRITTPDGNYPYGSSKDSVAGGDGTPYQKIRADDIFGFQQALLTAAGIVPSGSADTALTSQYLQSLKYIAGKNIYSNQINYQISSIAWGSDDQIYIALIANGPGSTTVDPVGDLTGTWVLLIDFFGTSLRPAGEIVLLTYEPSPAQLDGLKLLEANGASVLDADFPSILAAWGAKIYGNVDGTHFNLPDLRGRFLRFFNNGAGVDPDAVTRANRGDGNGGDQVGTLQSDQNRAHTHSDNCYANLNNGGNPRAADTSGAGPFVMTTTSSGGSESRPTNIYVFAGVRYND